jgi:carbonic anhydrase
LLSILGRGEGGRKTAALQCDMCRFFAWNARTAGNVVNQDVGGSLEFAAQISGVPLIVVLGHTHCGAVKGAIDGAKLGNFTHLLV